MEMQLFLIYRGKGFTWNDVDTMPIYELLWNYNTLVKWKEEEAQAMDNDSGGPAEDIFQSRLAESQLSKAK